MVQDVKFIGEWNAGVFQVLKRAYNVPVFHVSVRIAIGTDNQDAAMTPARGVDQIMQIAVIVVVFCQQNQIVLDRVKQMAGIPCSRKSGIRGLNHRMTCVAKPSNQRSLGRVVIEIKPHAEIEGLRGA